MPLPGRIGSLLRGAVRHAAPRRRRTLVVAGLVTVLLALTAGVLLAARSSPHRRGADPPVPPAPAPASAPVATAPTGVVTPVPARRVTPGRCPAGVALSSGGTAPSRVCIPAIGVDADVMSLGLNHDGTVQVPPLSRVGDAGWYRYSATAGAVGPTVILGHVDSAQYGRGVFFDLGLLRAGDLVVVNRADGRVATFRVDSVVEVAKSRFPTTAVYGATSGPAVRLVTCGGAFDRATGNYVDNIIASGTLLSLTDR